MKRMSWPRLEELCVRGLMWASLLAVGAILAAILVTIAAKGLSSLNLAMLVQTPQGGYYQGKEGGILNAIVGSLYLAGSGTLLALILSLPLALCLEIYGRRKAWADLVRLSLDALWGVPSIVYGAFAFLVMMHLGMRASLGGGILVLALLELPIMTRAMDEAIAMMPGELHEASLALGATRLEAAVTVVIRQTLPGLLTAVLLAFGRGIGDAASVLFTAGYSDRLPGSLARPAASLPLAIFFQLNTPFPEVQQRAYAAALVLTVIVLGVSLASRWLAARLGRYTVR